MPFEKGNKYGELSKISKDVFKKEIEEKMKEFKEYKFLIISIFIFTPFLI